MAVISIQTKRVADLQEILTVDATDMIMVHDGTGLKKARAGLLELVKNQYQGVFDPTTGLDGDGNALPTPATTNATWYWIASAAGTWTPPGGSTSITWSAGDWCISNGAVYNRIPASTVDGTARADIQLLQNQLDALGLEGGIFTKAVQLSEDIPTTLVIYVNPNTGNDANDGSSAAPLKTLSEVTSRINRRVAPVGPVYVYLADGIYNEPSSVRFVATGSSVIITGNVSSPENVIINTPSMVFDVFHAALLGFTINTTDTSTVYKALISVVGSGNMSNVIVNGISGINQTFGITISLGHLQLVECEINNCSRSAIHVYSFATIIICTGSGNGTGVATSGGVAVISQTAPAGTTNYTKGNGGIIFKDGVMV